MKRIVLTAGMLFCLIGCCAFALGELTEGSSGTDVLLLQFRLYENGCYDSEFDDIYDADVADAVKKFQKMCGTDATGTIDEKTLFLLDTVPANACFIIDCETREYHVLSCGSIVLANGSFRFCFDTEEAVISMGYTACKDCFADAAVITEEAAVNYIVNTNTGRFHLPQCHDIGNILQENRLDFLGSRDELIDMGYKPCGHCKPK